MNVEPHGINLALDEQAVFRPKQRVRHVPLCSQPEQRLICTQYSKHPSTNFCRERRGYSRVTFGIFERTRTYEAPEELLFVERYPPMGATESAKTDANVLKSSEWETHYAVHQQGPVNPQWPHGVHSASSECRMHERMSLSCGLGKLLFTPTLGGKLMDATGPT